MLERHLRPWGVLGVALASLVPSAARAEEEMTVESGARNCRVMNEISDKEVAAFRASQPPQPYPDPRQDQVLRAPWSDTLRGFGKAPPELWLATLLPHAGVTLRAEAPAFVLAWPWSFPVGPALTCSKHAGSLFVSNHYPFRIMFEPGMIYGDRLFVFFLRPGARVVWQPTDWVVGLGGGLGTTIDVVSRQEGFRASLSPEAVLRLGKCCDPSYFMLTGRLDVFFAGQSRVQPLIHLGFTYF